MPDTKNYIKQLTIDGQTLWLKDEEAREMFSSYTKFLGVTTTALEDGDTTNPITIGGESVTAVNGDITIYDAKEFIFNGTAWAEFGDLDALEDRLGYFAFADTGSVDVKEYADPQWEGTAVHFGFEGVSLTSTGTATVTGDISKPAITVDDDDTGTVGITDGTRPSLKVGNTQTDGTAYQVEVDAANENLSFTALTFNAGTKQELSGETTFVKSVTAELAATPTFTQTSGDVSVSGTPTGAIKVGEEITATGNYTPGGTVTQGTASTVTKTVNPVAKS